MVLASQNAPLASPMSGHTGAIYDTAVAGNGIVATASYDRTIRLWDPLSGKQLGGPLVGHTSWVRSEEHTSELQSIMRISYAVFCLKKTNHTLKKNTHIQDYHI